MNTKNMGDIAEQAVTLDLMKRGYGVCKPFGDNAPYDLIVDRDGRLERMQVKARSPRNGTLEASFFTMQYDSSGDTNNRTKMKHYGAEDFEWMAIMDITTNEIYYIPQSHFNKTSVSLRITAPKANLDRVRLAEDYKEI